MLDLHRHHLRAEAVGGDLEAQERARRIFEEGVDDGEAVEPMVVAPRLSVIGELAFALVEDGGDLIVCQIIDG
jgi:hypothetical protein